MTHEPIQKSKSLRLSRRNLCLTAVGASCTLLNFSGAVMAENFSVPNNETLEATVQAALWSSGSTARVNAADPSGKVSLHLRQAGIDAIGAAHLATALSKVSQSQRARLHSFSLSYNEIKDEGTIALAGALPRTLVELGLVNCSISDKGGMALLEWARRAQGLRMICVENNAMSAGMRSEFRRLQKTQPGLSVYV